MVSLQPKITVEPAQTIPDGATVRDYDELGWCAQRQFATVVDGGERHVDDETALQFTDGEFVKYTDYYRVVVT